MFGFKKHATDQARFLQVEQLSTRLKLLEDAGAQDFSPLERRIERLELDHGERHVAVLNTLEKIMRQLGARERKRVAANGDELEEGGTEMPPPSPIVRPGAPQRAPSGTAHLATRFRRF
ncbi:MAG: hypothetical protein ACREJC_22495 [Tepidisphaeraceae bacterium]